MTGQSAPMAQEVGRVRKSVWRVVQPRRRERVASGGPNEGTIRERADGRWEARALVTKPDGRRVRRSLLFRTRSDRTCLLVVPITQRLAQASRDPTRDGFLDGGQDVG